MSTNKGTNELKDMGTSQVVDKMKILIGCRTNENIYPHNNQSAL